MTWWWKCPACRFPYPVQARALILTATRAGVGLLTWVLVPKRGDILIIVNFIG